MAAVIKDLNIDIATMKLLVTMNKGGSDITADLSALSSQVSMQSGEVYVTTTAANVPASADVVFPIPFPGKPVILVSPYTTVPGTYLTGSSMSNLAATGFTAWCTRTNTGGTTLHWWAIYQA